jgi:hypothetical protein
MLERFLKEEKFHTIFIKRKKILKKISAIEFCFLEFQ